MWYQNFWGRPEAVPLPSADSAEAVSECDFCCFNWLRPELLILLARENLYGKENRLRLSARMGEICLAPEAFTTFG
jgi:hypothetical protein